MSSSDSSSNGIGILGLLGILFIGLKLTGFINWSWWWVTAPFWGGFALVVFIGLVWGIVWGVLKFVRARKKRIIRHE